MIAADGNVLYKWRDGTTLLRVLRALMYNLYFNLEFTFYLFLRPSELTLGVGSKGEERLLVRH